MNKISCDIFLDLYPLVKDNIASQDSIDLINNHIKECETCREIYELDIDDKNMNIIEEVGYNQKQIGKMINKSLLKIVLFLLSTGIFLGISINGNIDIKYSIFIMPLIGYISYKIFRYNSYKVGFMVFACSYIFQLLIDMFSNIEELSRYATFMIPAFLSTTYFILFIFGILIALSLEYIMNKFAKGNFGEK